MHVPDISRYMTHEPYAIASTESLAAARDLMNRHLIRHLPVIDGERLMGIVRDRDVELLANIPGVDLGHVEISRVMTPPLYVWSETPIDEVTAMMARGRFDCVVVRGGRGIEGIFTSTDALGVLARLFADRDDHK